MLTGGGADKSTGQVDRKRPASGTRQVLVEAAFRLCGILRQHNAQLSTLPVGALVVLISVPTKPSPNRSDGGELVGLRTDHCSRNFGLKPK